MTPISSTKTLDEVLYAFAVTKETPDAETLDRFSQIYPQYAEELTKLAIQLVFDSAQEEHDAVEETDEASPAVMRAISRFENYSYELSKGTAHTQNMSVITNPLLNLSRDDFRSLAAKLHANNTFLMKLRDRMIEPETVIARTGFCETVAEQLGVPMEAVIAHLNADPVIASNQYYKADNKPAIAQRETFEEAVKNSSLTEDQQKYILSL